MIEHFGPKALDKYQMKLYTCLLSCLLIISSCSSSQEESTTQDSNPLKQNTGLQVAAPAAIDKSNLLGIWWDSNDPNAPHAVFMIEDSTIHYPDQEEGEPSDFRYRIKGDSLVIEYTGFSTASKISKATGDTLELITEGDKLVLVKTEPKP